MFGAKQENLPQYIDRITILGNQAERIDAHLSTIDGDNTNHSNACTTMAAKVEEDVNRLIDLTRHGLTWQTAQTLARQATTKPQYIMRSILIPRSQREEDHKVTTKIWRDIFASTPGATDEQSNCRHHLSKAGSRRGNNLKGTGGFLDWNTCGDVG